MTESKNLVNVIKNIKKGVTYGLNIDGFSTLTDSNLSGLLETITKKEELEAFPDFVSEYINEKELNILLKKEINGEKFFDLLPVDFKINLIKKEKKFIKKIPKESIEILFSKMKNKDYEKENLSYIIPKLDLNNSHILNKIITNGRVLFQYLTEDQIKDLSDEAISKLDKACLLSIAEKNNLKYLPNPNAIKIEIFSGLTDEVKNKFSREQLLNLDKEHFNVAIEQNFVNIPRSFEEVKEFIKDENFPEHIAEYFITKIPKKDIISQINDIHNKYMFFITEENIKNLPKESAIQLARNNKLQYLSDIQLKNLNNLDLYNKYDINKLSGNLTEDQVKTQLKSLIESDKLQYLPKEVIGTMTDKIIKDSGEDFIKQLSVETLDYLSTINGDGAVIANKKICAIDLNSIDIKKFKQLKPETIKNFSSEQIGNLDKIHLMEILPKMTKEQAKNISLEQFDTIYKEDKNYITSEIIAGLDPKIICEQDEFLKNLTKEQAKSLSMESVTQLAYNNKLSLLKDNILFIIASEHFKDKNELKKLDIDTLTRISRYESKIKDLPLLDTNPVLTDFDTNFKSEEKETVFNVKNIKALMRDRIKNEEWEKLRNDCLYFCNNKEQKEEIYSLLQNEINLKETNLYGIIDKIQLLLISMLLVKDSKLLNSDYEKFEDNTRLLVDEPCYTVDEYFSKSDLFSSLISNENVNIDLREKLCKEQIKLMEKNFVNDFYTKSGKNSLNSNVKDEISKAYLNYATILVERNKINTSKFEKQLSDEDVRNLNSEEIKYYNCIKKVYEYTPDLESKIRYWTATGTRLATKAIATFFTAKAAISSKSRIVSLGAGVGAVATGVSTISDTSNVVEQFFTLDLGNRKEIHKKERNGKLSLFKKFTRNLKKIFNKFKNIFIVKNNFFNIKKLNTNQESRAKEYLDNNLKNIKNQEMLKLKKQLNEKEKNMLEKLLKKDEKSKQLQLIKDSMNLQTNALKIKNQKKVIELKKEYPEFMEDRGILGIFSKLKNIGKSILNGAMEGFLDTATLGYGGDVYKKLTEGKTDEEKIKIESRLISFQKKVSDLDKELVNELNDLQHRTFCRLASANKQDGQKLQEFEEKFIEQENKISEKMSILRPDKKIILEKNGLLSELHEIDNKTKEINQKSLESLNESIETLINNNNLSLDLKQKNIEKVNSVLEKETANGNLNIQDPKIAQNLATMLKAMDKFIATQMAISYASTVGLDAVRQKELEREKARINDMQQKLKENGTNHLAISSEQELRIY